MKKEIVFLKIDNLDGTTDKLNIILEDIASFRFEVETRKGKIEGETEDLKEIRRVIKVVNEARRHANLGFIFKRNAMLSYVNLQRGRRHKTQFTLTLSENDTFRMLGYRENS